MCFLNGVAKSKLSRYEGFEKILDRVSRRSGTTQRVPTPQRALQNKRVLRRRGVSPTEEANTSTPKPIIKSKDRMHVVDSGASLRMMEKALSLRRKNQTKRHSNNTCEIQTANGMVLFHKNTMVYIQEHGTCLFEKLVEDSPSVLSLGRLFDEWVYLYTHSPVARTFFCCTVCLPTFAHLHACHIHAWLKCLKRFIAHVSYLSISPSPVS